MSQHNKINIALYVLLAANLLPIFAVLSGVWEFKNAMYIYWGECALAGILAVAMYAKYLIVFFLMALAIGLIVYTANPALLASGLRPVFIFWLLYSLCWLLYIEYGKSAYGQTIKKLKPLLQLAVYFGFMALSITVCFGIAILISGQWGSPDNEVSFYASLCGMAVIVPSISIGIVRLIDIIGPRHFIDFVLGTYQQPQERDSVILFLDMAESSSIAEKLEPKESMDLIARFIYDSSYIFRIHGGDIINYTGDGLVVSWPRKNVDNALAAAHALRKHFSSKPVRDRYWKKYLKVPDFRIGLHAGPVVISQIGEEKLFIGVYGDIINTASRLEQMNKEYGTYVLLSSDVAQGLNQSWKTMLKPLGKQPIRGRDEPVSVFTLYSK